MNNQDFQQICSTLKIKYEERRLTDSDVDAFADVITNVLSREDLRAKGTEYEKLSNMLKENYEGNVRMNPLLARMYELCRMYEHYRRRPLTEMERKEEQMEIEANSEQLYPVSFVCSNGRITLASCWFKDLENVDGIMDVLEQVIPVLDAELENATDDDGRVFAATKSFASIGAGIDPLDKGGKDTLLEFMDENDIPTNADLTAGMLAVDKAGTERNKNRGGAKVKIDLVAKTIRIDCYTVYGLAFYRTLTHDDTFVVDGKEPIHDDNIEFSFTDAPRALNDWRERLGDTFAIPGSPSLVGTKRPLPLV